MMERKGSASWFKGAFGLGVFLVVLALFTLYIEARPTLFVIVGGALGIVAIGVAIFVSFVDISEFLKVWWLGLALVLDAGLLLVFAGSLEEMLGLESVKLWLVLFGLMFAVDAIWFAAWWFVFRQAFPGAAARSAAAANVAVVAKLGVLLLVVVNWFGANHVTQLVGTYDTTETGIYTLGDATRKLLDSLADKPGNVTATYVDFGSNLQPVPGGGEPLGNRGKEFLQQYGDYCPGLDIEIFSAFQDMAEVQKHFRELGIEDLGFDGQDTIVFTYRKPGEDVPNRKDVEVSSWTFLETSPLGTKKFKGEQLLTSAIRDVVYPRKKVYFLTGHDELRLSGGGQVNLAEAAELTRKLALDTESLSLIDRAAVPEDADLIVVAGPQRPLVDREVEAISNWLHDGGSLLLLLDPDVGLIEGQEPVSIGFDDLLAGYGIDVKSAYLCMDYDEATTTTASGYTRSPVLLTTDYSFHGIVKDLKERRLGSRFYEACPVMKEMPENAEGLEVDELVYMRRHPPGREQFRTYAARLYPGRVLEREEPRNDILDKRISLGIAAEKTRGEGENAVVSRVVVFGQSGFASTLGLNIRSRLYAPGNATLYSNSVAWAVKREALMAIEAKTLETETVALSDLETRLARTVSVFMIPVFVLLLGIGVWWRRRR